MTSPLGLHKDKEIKIERQVSRHGRQTERFQHTSNQTVRSKQLGNWEKKFKKNLIKPEMIMKLKDRHKDSD